MTNKQEVSVRETKDTDVIAIDRSPAGMIIAAIGKGDKQVDLVQLKELLNMQREHEAYEAKKAYHVAMAEFKANPPEIEKDKTVAYGTTKYTHASLANVTKKINSELSKHGLSASWTTNQADKISVTCKITHVKGHSEETTLTAPADASGQKNAIQQIGSTISYLQRYTILALTGLATSDMDNDAQEEVEYIGKDEVNTILDLLAELNANMGTFCTFMKVTKIEEIRKEDYAKAIKALEAKKKAGVKA